MTTFADAAPREIPGFFAIVGPGRRPIGDHIVGAMRGGPSMSDDTDLSAVFSAAAPVRFFVPCAAMRDGDCEEAARIGFFSALGALMWTARTRAQVVGQPLDLPGVRVIDGT